jgi:integrase
MQPTQSVVPRRVRVERGIYRQDNGKYAVCFMVDGRPRFRTIGADLDAARAARQQLTAAAAGGCVAVSPRLTFSAVAGRWLERFAVRVQSGQRRQRTYDAHRYHLRSHLLPALARRRVSAITVEDVADLITAMRMRGISEKTIAGAVSSLHSILRYALRQGWIATDPVARLEHHERTRPVPRRQRALGRNQIAGLLQACPPRDRLLVATALFTGMRISELLGLVWADVDTCEGLIHVRGQLSRGRRGESPRRVAPKTPSAIRDIPVTPQLAAALSAHHHRATRSGPNDWVFATSNGTPLGHRNAQRRALSRAARDAGLDDGDWPPLRFHDLRHVFASHLIVDLGLDVAQVSRILGHARVTITLDVYTHLFDTARHANEIRARMAGSAFAGLLDRPLAADEAAGTVVRLPRQAATRA